MSGADVLSDYRNGGRDEAEIVYFLDTEIAKHILSGGAAPIYFVEVPGFVAKVPGMHEQAMLGEHEVARQVAELCQLPEPRDEFIAVSARIIRQIRDRRQITADFVQPFQQQGLDALRREDLRRVLAGLARDLDERSQRVRQAAASENTVPPYNKRFCGRLEELLDLRQRLKDDRAGVICGVHGLGGIGKSELAFTYAHAFASAYPGGRFNNLAWLLVFLNRPAEAVPLMRRTITVLLKCTVATGQQHPHLLTAIRNLGSFLYAMGHSDAEIRQQVNDLLAEYGMSIRGP